MVIRPEPLTREAFRPFGDVIEIEGRVAETINRGNTEKYADLARLVSLDDGRLALSIYRSRAVQPPVMIKAMECHPLGSQAFIPLHQRPFPVIVALPGTALLAGDIRAFLSNGLQGVNLLPGTWHHYQLSFEKRSDYLVIDRAGEGGNLEERELETPLFLQL
jgi:ureidoglycolate lyase